ncbi:MAG: hypothetical protein J6I84_02965 [Bacilli bacterium]|nr:hypothetical protein [Bacilli bacterium]
MTLFEKTEIFGKIEVLEIDVQNKIAAKEKELQELRDRLMLIEIIRRRADKPEATKENINKFLDIV